MVTSNINSQQAMLNAQLKAYSDTIANPDTQQALANLGIGLNVAGMAGQLPLGQLQSLGAMGAGFQDQFGVAQEPGFAMGMPLAAQMPYNVMQPGMALAASMPALAPSYYSGPQQYNTMPQMLNQMQSQFPMGQQYMQQALGQPQMQQALQQYYNNPQMMAGGGMQPGGPFGGLAGLNNGPAMGAPNAGIPGAQGTNVPGGANLTPDELKDQQTALLQKQISDWSNAISLWSNIESKMSQINSSIIQNIR